MTTVRNFLKPNMLISDQGYSSQLSRAPTSLKNTQVLLNQAKSATNSPSNSKSKLSLNVIGQKKQRQTLLQAYHSIIMRGMDLADNHFDQEWQRRSQINLSPREKAELELLYKRAMSNCSPVDGRSLTSSDMNVFPDKFRETLANSTFKFKKVP